MAGIKDIAERAGASIATVSRVINGSGYVAAATRARTAFFDAGPHLTVSPVDGVHYATGGMPAFGLALADAFRHQFGD